MHDISTIQSLASLARAPGLNRRDGNRVCVTLPGHCSINGGQDLACSTIDISMSGASLNAPADPEVGDQAKLVLSQVGLIDARVVRRLPAGFAVEFDDMLSARAIRMISWLRECSDGGEAHRPDGRRHGRIVPINKLVRVTRDRGTTVLCRAIDLSRSGISIHDAIGLDVRERVAVGERAGTVVRTWQGGAAVEFDEPLPAERFDIGIDLR